MNAREILDRPSPRQYTPATLFDLRESEPAASVVPLLHDRIALDGRPTAYVCRRFVCRLPVVEPAALRAEHAATASLATPR